MISEHTDLSGTVYNELLLYAGTDAPSYPTVKRLAQSYREGKQEIEDSPRPGRPIVSTTTENIDLIRSIINDDPMQRELNKF